MLLGSVEEPTVGKGDGQGLEATVMILNQMGTPLLGFLGIPLAVVLRIE